MTCTTVTDEGEAFNMGKFAGRAGYSCLRPSNVRFPPAARLAYQKGWEEGLDERMNAQAAQAVCAAHGATFKEELTPAGPQLVIPGCERVAPDNGKPFQPSLFA